MRSSRRLATACALTAFTVLGTVTVAYAAPTPTPTLPSTDDGKRAVVERTETSTTYRGADGRTVTELHAGPIRIKQDDGGWADIDTSLIEDGAAIRPKAAKGDVRFSGGGKDAFAQLVREGGDKVEVGWDGELPKPVLDGNKAVYRGVAAVGAGDLVATALPTGLRFDIVLNRRPDGPVEIKIPVAVEGLTLADNGSGQLAFKDGGKVIASSSKPVMYDATSPHAYRARGGKLARSAPHGGRGQDRAGEITTDVQNTADGKTLVLKPADSFLADPATAYPVTVDPSVVLPLNGDTDVNSAFDGNNVSGGYLKAGTEADGEKARAYLRFNTAGLKTPSKAILKLTNLDAPACGPKVGAGIQVRRVTDFWDATKQTWTPQPSNITEDAVTSTEGSQLGSCGTGTMTWDVTPIVTKWAAGTANHGLVLQAPTETKVKNYRVFAAAENSDGLDAPMLEVTSDEPFTPGEGDDPADPGPAPEDLYPGRADTDTGVWITDATDFTDTGLIVTRSHSAGQRIDLTLLNEAVLGPNWRLEPLGGILGNRLKDYSSNGYIQINLGKESARFTADAAKPGTFAAANGDTVVKNADGGFTQTMVAAGEGAPTLTYTWTKVGDDHLITKIGNADGVAVISYDAQGRYIRLAAPATPQDDCSTAACATVTFTYATATTATSSALGDVTGQLKAIGFTPAGGGASGEAVTYGYDNAKRLRQVTDNRKIDDEPVQVSTYTYDTKGNITALNTPALGSWNLTYEAIGKLKTATQPATVGLRASAKCQYMSQYLYGRDGCNFGPVPMEYGGRLLTPARKVTPTKKWVMGVKNDHCSNAPDRPRGYNFESACDMHDYGYGIIYKSKTDKWNKSKKAAADSILYSVLKDNTCPAYGVRRADCWSIAYGYWWGVTYGGGWSM
ncbi:phospholipase A2 [Nonomuraea sp. NPDC055795]